jgi:hypothetical protein
LIGKDIFKLYYYNAAGQWEKEYKIGFNDVIRIEWVGKYCVHFNKYMRTVNNQRS